MNQMLLRRTITTALILAAAAAAVTMAAAVGQKARFVVTCKAIRHDILHFVARVLALLCVTTFCTFRRDLPSIPRAEGADAGTRFGVPSRGECVMMEP